MTNRKTAKPADRPTAAGYTVLARRYRSRDFDELIGQEPIARTLQNAIKTNRTAHAYLFCGTRGVGKTSMARIFAKALNAVDGLSQKKEIGEAILRGDDLDVIEIDGASNRGIDNARDLIAGASLSPTRSPNKIYIIDEVHMLTKEAFNALLKTMEEPPSHVKFILCTTEPHKVPATIQSRCQRFDFRAISSSKIAEQLKMILKQEGIDADDEVVLQVSRLGNGSMRDALSLMDRLLAGGERHVTTELLEEMLGLPDHSLINELVEAIIAADPKAALERGAELMARGATVEQALEWLAEHYRHLMIIAACGEGCDFLELTEESRKSAAKQAANFDAPALVHMIAICDAVTRNSRNSSSARALFDAAVVRMAMSAQFVDISSRAAGKPLPAGAGRPALGDGDSKKKAIEIEPRSRQNREEDRESATGVRFATVAEMKPAGADEDLWPRVLQVASQSLGDKMRTDHLVFESFDGSTLRLSIDESGAEIASYLTRERDKIVELVKRATGRSVRIELDDSRFQARSRGPIVEKAAAADVPEIVKKAIDLFDASIVAVEDVGQAPRTESGTNLESPHV